MMKSGSFHLFTWKGIDVSVHWAWFIVAIYSISSRSAYYSSLAWNVAEYLALFVIVLMHEFGHALACRQVGGHAERIVLWPLGGVAFVDPPQRPGATLWAIAAGPLVNVLLLPLAFVVAFASDRMGWGTSFPDAQRLLWSLVYINVGLLIFNLLPIYPLDGGQILRSLLWFGLGRARSLMVATVIGVGGALLLIAIAAFLGSLLMGIMAGFILMTCWKTWGQAKMLSRLESVPRRSGYACPACKTAPPAGPFWVCHQCRIPFDVFASGGICPNCQSIVGVAPCVHCGALETLPNWVQPPPLGRV